MIDQLALALAEQGIGTNLSQDTSRGIPTEVLTWNNPKNITWELTQSPGPFYKLTRNRRIWFDTANLITLDTMLIQHKEIWQNQNQ